MRTSLNITSLAIALCGLLSFAAGAAEPAWPDYQIIMWQDQTPARLAGLARLGVTAGKIRGRGPLDADTIARETAPFRQLGLHWYIENIATDFYSTYHRWFPDREKTWMFDEAKDLHQREPANLAAFVRTPSLSDPIWLNRIARRLDQHVHAYARPRPLFYNLADEAGIGDLAAAWDFDFAPESLDGMRAWLQQQYPTLAALNSEWGSQFTSWSAVIPMTTDAALRQQDENFAPWSDFKEWMDIAFARAVRTGTNAVHAADPRALAALEGGQIPGWGGYDYSRLASAVDVMEIYDIDNNVEVARSLDPGLTVLQTTSLSDAEQIHTIWHELLLGGRGLIIWDEDHAFVDDDGGATARGRVLGALATDLRSGLAAQLIASTPAADPVAVLYSPASQRLEWLLDRKADGKPWAERKAETEYKEENPARVATRRAAGLLTHLGISPQWLTSAMIEGGALSRDHIRVLVLPHALALSSAEISRIRDFVAAGGTVLADVEPGRFDQHGRRRDQPPLTDLTAAGSLVLEPDFTRDPSPGDPMPLTRLRQRLTQAGAPPRFALSSADGTLAPDIDARVFTDAGTTIIGLQRDWADSGESTVHNATIDLAAPAYVYDLRHPGPPHHAARVTVPLDGVAPAIVAVMPEPLPALALNGPGRARPGSSVEFKITGAKQTWTGSRAVHVEVVAPDGTDAPSYPTNLVLRGARLTWRLLLAQNAPPGDWTVRLVDAQTGQKSERKLSVR